MYVFFFIHQIRIPNLDRLEEVIHIIWYKLTKSKSTLIYLFKPKLTLIFSTKLNLAIIALYFFSINKILNLSRPM